MEQSLNANASGFLSDVFEVTWTSECHADLCYNPWVTLDASQTKSVYQSANAQPQVDSQQILGEKDFNMQSSVNINKNKMEMELSNIKVQKRTLGQEISFELLNFCKTTSIRGVPTIVTTSNTFQRYLWTTFVFAFFTGCIYCLVFLVNNYRAYDVIHQSKTVKNEPQPFPSFTICNTRPLSRKGKAILQKRGIMSPEEWVTKLGTVIKDYIKQQEQSTKPLTLDEKRYLSGALNLNYYLQSLPPNISREELGHGIDDMIIKCIVSVRSGSFIYGRSCHRTGNWTLTYSEQYLNCHSYTINSTAINNTLSCTLILYLGELGKQCEDCFNFDITSQVQGLRLQVHEAGTYPKVNENGLYLMPGTLTEIQFQINKWKMLQKPYGKCSPDVKSFITICNQNFSYSQDACKQKTIEKHIEQKCSCLNYGAINADDRKQNNNSVSLCYKNLLSTLVKDLKTNISMNNSFIRNEFLKSVECSITTKMDRSQQILNCYSGCAYYTYDTAISSTNWPAKSFVNTFCDKIRIMTSKPMEKITNRTAKFNKMSDIFRIIDYEMSKAANLSSFVENHFLAIQISRLNFDYEVRTEKPVVSLTTLLSQIGGLLSIWIGLTFICVVEIIELLLNILEYLIRGK